MENRTYVSGISFDSTQLALREAFSVHSEVTELFVTGDWPTGRPRRISRVTWGTTEQAERAFSAFAGSDSEAESDSGGEIEERRGAKRGWPRRPVVDHKRSEPAPLRFTTA